MTWKLIAQFGCEGRLWSIYHQDRGGEIAYCSTSVDWPGGDEWVENIHLKGPHLEDVLPELWVRYHPRGVATKFVALFREAYLPALECLSADERQYRRCEDQRWRKLLGLPEREEDFSSPDLRKPK